MKTRWYNGKYLLRKAMLQYLPREVVRRRKKPFLAPFGTPFIGEDSTDEIRDLLSPARLAEFGYFDPGKVSAIIAELEQAKTRIAQDLREPMRANQDSIHRMLLGIALTFVVSTQALEAHVRRGRF